MHKMIRLLGALAFATAALPQVAAAATLPKPRYLVTDIGQMPAFDGATFGLALNQAGQVTGYGLDASGFYAQAFVGTAGQLRPGPQLGGTTSVGQAINSAGQVAGYADQPGGTTYHAFLYGNGATMDLGTLGGGDYSAAYGLNDHGLVVGASTADSSHVVRPFRWSAGVMRALPGLRDDGAGLAAAVNNRRTIVGQASAPDGHYDAVVWRHNQATDIDPGRAVSLASTASSVNDSDTVAGHLLRAEDGRWAPFVWSAGSLTMLAMPFTGQGFAWSINKTGVIVGAGCPADTGECRAMLWKQGTALDLNQLVDPVSGAGVVLQSAASINDKGQILAQGTYMGAFGHTFLLTPR